MRACWLVLLMACGTTNTSDEPPAIDKTQEESAKDAPDAVVGDGQRRVNGALVFDGAPDPDPKITAALAPYQGLRSASVRDFADDGSKALIRTRFGRANQLHEVSTPMGMRSQVTFRPEPINNGAYRENHPNQILYVADQGGDEQYQGWVLNTKTGKTTLLTDGKSRHAQLLGSPDGKSFLFSNNSRNGKDMDLYIAPFSDPKAAKQVVEADGHFGVSAWSKDGSRLLVEKYISITKTELYVVDVATKAKTQIPADGYIEGVGFNGENSVILITDEGTEFRKLYDYNLSTKERTLITDKTEWGVDGASLSEDGKLIGVNLNEGGRLRLALFDAKTRAPVALPTLPKGQVGLPRWSADSRRFAVTVWGATRLGDVFIVDLAKNTATQWTESEAGGLNSDRFVSPELVTTKGDEGHELPAWLYMPKKAEKAVPVVVMIHGGPEGQSRPYFSPLTQYLVSELGFAVLVPNVRGSSGYGKTWVSIDNGFGRKKSVADIGSWLDYIDAAPKLDGKRVAVKGGSYGGYMVLASLVDYGDRIKAGIDSVGISNFVTFLKNTKAYRRDLRRVEYGDERDEKMHEFLQSISPSNHAEKIRSRLFVVHGANDPRVPVGEAEQIVEAVRKAGNDVWYLRANNEGHGFRKQENKEVLNALQIQFLAESLK